MSHESHLSTVEDHMGSDLAESKYTSHRLAWRLLMYLSLAAIVLLFVLMAVL